MIDPDNAAPARGIVGKLGEDPANARVPTASRILQTVLRDKDAALTDDSEQDDHEAPRPVPTMWR